LLQFAVFTIKLPKISRLRRSFSHFDIYMVLFIEPLSLHFFISTKSNVLKIRAPSARYELLEHLKSIFSGGKSLIFELAKSKF